jgi:hypothetical protein
VAGVFISQVRLDTNPKRLPPGLRNPAPQAAILRMEYRVRHELRNRSPLKRDVIAQRIFNMAQTAVTAARFDFHKVDAFDFHFVGNFASRERERSLLRKARVTLAEPIPWLAANRKLSVNWNPMRIRSRRAACSSVAWCRQGRMISGIPRMAPTASTKTDNTRSFEVRRI